MDGTAAVRDVQKLICKVEKTPAYYGTIAARRVVELAPEVLVTLVNIEKNIARFLCPALAEHTVFCRVRSQRKSVDWGTMGPALGGAYECYAHISSLVLILASNGNNHQFLFLRQHMTPGIMNSR